jgi:hypothetical protein
MLRKDGLKNYLDGREMPMLCEPSNTDVRKNDVMYPRRHITNLQLYIRGIKSPGLDYLRMKAKAI